MITHQKAAEALQNVADRAGIQALSGTSGVPVSTIYDLKRRGWTNKSVQTFFALLAAATGGN
jgi:hypothetical protein